MFYYPCHRVLTFKIRYHKDRRLAVGTADPFFQKRWQKPLTQTNSLIPLFLLAQEAQKKKLGKKKTPFLWALPKPASF